MIEKETSKEPAEGGDGSHRLGDAQEMRAVVLAGFGGLNKLRLSRKAMPEPQDGELKIRVKAWSSIHDFLVFLSFRAGRTGSGWESPRLGMLPQVPSTHSQRAPSLHSHLALRTSWVSPSHRSPGRMLRGGSSPHTRCRVTGRIVVPRT